MKVTPKVQPWTFRLECPKCQSGLEVEASDLRKRVHVSIGWDVKIRTETFFVVCQGHDGVCKAELPIGEAVIPPGIQNFVAEVSNSRSSVEDFYNK